MKGIVITLLAALCSGAAAAQLTVEECWQKARENYPLIARMGLIDQAEGYTLENASRAYLPQAQLNARATYQSDVTSLPISLPGVEIPTLPKDNYDAKVELSQLIWDGGRIRAQREAVRTGARVNRQSLEVDLYTLRERVDQLFFSILLLDGQMEQNRLLEEELARNYERVKAYVEGGVASRADLDAVQVEQLNARQNGISMRSAREAYAIMLGTMIGVEGSLQLTAPAVEAVDTKANNRPEMALFDAQQANYRAQLRGIRAANLPALGGFVQGGYGRPGLNMLSTAFEPYYMAGVRLTWNFGSLYTKKNDKLLVENGIRNVDALRETFLLNTSLQLTQQQHKADNLRELMREDDRIVELRGNIRRAAEARMAGGTMSGTELMREVYAENLARQNRVLHRIQLLQAIYEMKTTVNE